MSRWEEEIEIDGEDWAKERREVGSAADVIDLIPCSANGSSFWTVNLAIFKLFLARKEPTSWSPEDQNLEYHQ